MRYAVLADIHACTDALERVLEDAEHQGAEKLIVAGDVVGYGPDPNGVVDLLRAWDAVCVLGNHDAAVVGSGGTDGMIGSAREGVERHRRELGASELEWLKSLPLVHEDAVFGVAHGDFASPTKMSYLFDERDAQSSFFRTNAPILFVGHTHLEARFEFGFISDPHFPDCIKTAPGTSAWPRADATSSIRGPWGARASRPTRAMCSSIQTPALSVSARSRSTLRRMRTR